jgi:RNA-binding protein
MKTLNTRQRKYLKGLAHHLKPVVTIGGKGLTATVVEELETSIAHHELMKIKLPAGSRSERETLLGEACSAVHASAVTLIGRTGVLFRAAPKSRFQLPD